MHKTKGAFWVTCNALLAVSTNNMVLNACIFHFGYKTTILTTFLSNTTYLDIALFGLEANSRLQRKIS